METVSSRYLPLTHSTQLDSTLIVRKSWCSLSHSSQWLLHHRHPLYVKLISALVSILLLVLL